jgi:membrane fusion protein (multidrug efflux system)
VHRCLVVRQYVLAGLVALTGGCREKAPPAPPPGPIEVGTVQIRPRRVVLTTELPGRTSAFRIAEVRARVDGIVLKRLYVEGNDVVQGQPLFQIDPAPFRAALQSARAQLAGAQATEVSATLLAERYSELIRTHAVSRQEYDDAIARQGSARANVEAARAAVTSAQINLGYTLVRSPISGRSGPSNVTEGAYVQAAQATLLTSVTQLDPIYMDTAWPTLELMRVRRALARGQLVTSGGNPEVEVVLEDGSEHPYPGTLLLTGVRVDPTTGSVALRALVPNPRGELLAGMYVHARIDEGSQPDALLVPQRAVTRDPQGRATTFVVGPGGKVELRQLQTDRAIDESWLVTKGIAAGDNVIVEGRQKVQPGATVKMVAVPEKPSTPRQARTPRGT